MAAPGSLPLYQQISELLIRDIAAGRLIDGERLPPERDMAADLGIAVGTLRQALKDADRKGPAGPGAGVGQLCPRQGRRRLGLCAVPAGTGRGGGLPTARVLSVDRCPRTRACRPSAASDEGHRIRRLRFLSGVRSRRSRKSGWMRADVDADQPSATCRNRFTSTIASALASGLPGPRTASARARCPTGRPPNFRTAPGTPLPLITRISWAQDGQAVEASWTWYDPETVRYVARLK